MLAQERRDAVSPVLLGVFFPAGAKDPAVQHPQRGGEYPVFGKPFPGEVVLDLGAPLRQPFRHGEHAVVLLLVAFAAPLVVVAILAPPGVVGPDGLDVPAWIR